MLLTCSVLLLQDQEAIIKKDEVKALFVLQSFAMHSSNEKYKMFMKNNGAKNNMELDENKRKILI